MLSSNFTAWARMPTLRKSRRAALARRVLHLHVVLGLGLGLRLWLRLELWRSWREGRGAANLGEHDVGLVDGLSHLGENRWAVLVR